MMSSLRKDFAPSTNGCKRPNGPTRQGPQRFWMRPTSLRSSSTVYATPNSITTVTTATLSTLHRMNHKIVTGLQPLLIVLLFPYLHQHPCLMSRELPTRSAEFAPRCGGKQTIVSGNDLASRGQRRDWNEALFCLH